MGAKTRSAGQFHYPTPVIHKKEKKVAIRLKKIFLKSGTYLCTNKRLKYQWMVTKINKTMNIYKYSHHEKMSTNKGLSFQLCTELSTISTERGGGMKTPKIRQNPMNNEQKTVNHFHEVAE